MICSRNINVQVFIGLCLLVATTLSLPLQEAQSDDHGINTRQVPDQCNNALIQQAIPHARSAVEKSNYIYDSLKSMFEEYLAPCVSSSIHIILMHALIIDTITIILLSLLLLSL